MEGRPEEDSLGNVVDRNGDSDGGPQLGVSHGSDERRETLWEIVDALPKMEKE